MIITFIINTIIVIIGFIFSLLPTATIESLPIIGSSISGFLDIVLGYWYGFVNATPHFALVWNVFIYIILPFELGLLVMKFLLGSRSPTN